MLESLRIQNIALVTFLELNFHKGLNVLSGETGAGKTIIIDSINFILGERADKTLIRSGENFAEVEAVFSLDDNQLLRERFASLKLDFTREVTVFRKMALDGKNECRLNGVAVSLQNLRSLTSLIADIHGQHEHQSLLKPENHLDILDKYAERDIKVPLKEYGELYSEYKQIESLIKKYGTNEERERKIESLKYEIDEISSVNLTQELEDEVTRARQIAGNFEQLMSKVSFVYNALSGGEDVNCLQITSDALNSLKDASKYDERLVALSERLESAEIEIKDIADSVKDIADGYNYDPKYFEETEIKYDKIKLLHKKYGATVKDVLDYYDKIRKEYELLIDMGVDSDKREKEFGELKEKLFNAGVKLSEARRKGAAKFEKEIMDSLADLGMKNSVFSVEFSDIDSFIDDTVFKANGIDSAEYLISANVGEPLKPLARIISGGEMSRLMLAIKTVTAKLDGIDLLVFDEIDTGISGNIAISVARKMSEIAENSQVIAVSHLPSIAAIADYNYFISKSVENGKTSTHIKQLDEQSKIKEIARLSGGLSGELAENHAKQLILEIKG